MARTTEAAVKEIIEVDESISLTPFVAAAASLVDEIAVDSGHTEDRLTLIETWLAAHLYTIRDPRPVSEAAGPVNTTYQSRVDLGLATSHYGQMAMALDTSGLLKSLSSAAKRTVSVVWLGKTQEEIEQGGIA